MNQQQGSQESFDQSTNDGEQGARQASPLQSPSPWQIQGKRRTHEGPKSEHPATYDESIPPLSYQAQDYGQASSSSSPYDEASTRVEESPRVGASARVGGSPRVGARPTPMVHSWARPQQNNFGIPWLLGWLIAGIIMFPVLCVIIKLLIAFIPFVFLIVLIVPILLGAALLAFIVIAIFWLIAKIHSIFWW